MSRALDLLPENTVDLSGAIVSEGFREKLLNGFPILLHHPKERERVEWFRFLNLICFDVPRSKTLRMVIPHEMVAATIGRDPSDFSSGAFIAKFTEYVLPNFVVSLHDHRTGKAREILNDGLGTFKKVIEQELHTFHLLDDSKKVHLVTGERWTPPRARALRERDREVAEREVPKVTAAKRIVGYLNSLKSNLFAAKVNANITRAIDVAKKIDDKRRQTIELTKLHRISVQPQPFYGPPADAHTVRVFAKNVSIPNLKNDLKAALIDGWTTFDLKSAQFAIVAKDWGITDLHAELTKGIDIWKTLTDLYSTLDPMQVKPLLKTAVYSVCYGMSRENVISELTDGFIELGCSEFDAHIWSMTFVDDAYVLPLFRHRETTLEKVKRDRGAKDCFGQWIATSKEVQPRRVLAQLSQAREMHLLLPALDLAKSREGEFKIVLWEHDGFSVHFTRKDRIESESQRIIDAVNERCSNLGYPTRLERKDPSPSSQPTV